MPATTSNWRGWVLSNGFKSASARSGERSSRYTQAKRQLAIGRLAPPSSTAFMSSTRASSKRLCARSWVPTASLARRAGVEVVVVYHRLEPMRCCAKLTAVRNSARTRTSTRLGAAHSKPPENANRLEESPSSPRRVSGTTVVTGLHGDASIPAQRGANGATALPGTSGGIGEPEAMKA